MCFYGTWSMNHRVVVLLFSILQLLQRMLEKVLLCPQGDFFILFYFLQIFGITYQQNLCLLVLSQHHLSFSLVFSEFLSLLHIKLLQRYFCIFNSLSKKSYTSILSVLHPSFWHKTPSKLRRKMKISVPVYQVNWVAKLFMTSLDHWALQIVHFKKEFKLKG